MDKNLTTASLDYIRAILLDDGYAQLIPRAAEIRDAARTGTLLWTRDRLTTTNASKIDERPRPSITSA